MDIKVGDNIRATFKGVFYNEKEGSWIAIDLHFNINGKRWSQRYFAAKTHKQKKKLNLELKQIFETISDKKWTSLPHEKQFEKFVNLYREALMPFVDKEYYIKTIPRGEKWVALGFELPIISRKSDLFYGGLEEMRIASANNKVDEGGDSRNTTAPATRSSYTPPTAKPLPELPNLRKLNDSEQKSVDSSKSAIEKARPNIDDDLPF